MKETMIKMFDDMLENIVEQLRNPDITEYEADQLLDSYIEVKKILEKLKE